MIRTWLEEYPALIPIHSEGSQRCSDNSIAISGNPIPLLAYVFVFVRNLRLHYPPSFSFWSLP